MTTKAQLQAWLKSSSAIRVVLVEITGVGGAPSSSYFLSNRPYTSKTTDSPANQVYDACITGGVTFSQSLDLSGGNASLSFGDIELDNLSGNRDDWLNYIWANKPVTIRIGDAGWARTDFYVIFDGLIKDVDSKSRTSVNLILVDKLQKLNVPVFDTTVTSASASTSAQLKPLLFGECFNVTPLTLNAANLVYQVHTGAMEGIIELRDNGAPITSYSANNTTGEFTLSANPAGAITCSVQGSKLAGTYSNKIGSIISHLLTTYGKTVTTGELDATKLAQYDSATKTFSIAGIATAGVITLAETQGIEIGDKVRISGTNTGGGSIGSYSPAGTDYFIINKSTTTVTLSLTSGGSAVSSVSGTPVGLILANQVVNAVGIYLSERENLLDVCQKIAFSVGAYLTTGMSSTGVSQFRLVQLRTPDVNQVVDYDLGPSDIEERSLQVSTKIDVEGAVKLGYCKNWTPQESGLALGLSARAVAVLNKDWFYSIQQDPSVLTTYDLKAEPEARESYLINKVSADLESARLLALKKTPRFIYTATYLSHMLPVELGDWVKLTNRRFNFSGSKVGQVISVDRDWLRGRVTIGIFI